MQKITSLHLKYGLMDYFRYKRQWICADEIYSGFFITDILVDTGKWTMEVEIKVTKSDLLNGEERKVECGCNKHDHWPIGRTNKFALCVPESLVGVAKQWIDRTNKKYGLFVYLGKSRSVDAIWVERRARSLHNEYSNVNFKQKLLKRLSSCRTLELQGLMFKYDEQRRSKCL